MDFKITHFESGAFFGEVPPVYDLVLMTSPCRRSTAWRPPSACGELDRTTTIIFVTNMAQFAVHGAMRWTPSTLW